MATSEQENLKKQLDTTEKELERLEHQRVRLENRCRYLANGDRKKRPHHLCNMGGAIQSLSKEADALTKVEFFSLMEQIFSLNEVQELVQEAMKKHNEGSES